MDKKSVADTTSRTANRKPEKPMQQPTVEVNALQRGQDPKEVREATVLGGFLKGLGPKRMLDAQCKQT
ncbi:hypothetical protein STEG23_019663, partial [Scotinomys teguina]